jgi:S1-C subfamily serine protease
LVRAVQEGSPAAGAGIKRGDLIVRAGQHEIVRIDALHDALERAAAGKRLELGIVRGSEELAVDVELEEVGA